MGSWAYMHKALTLWNAVPLPWTLDFCSALIHHPPVYLRKENKSTIFFILLKLKEKNVYSYEQHQWY